jgi:hypothetical protein
VAVVVAARVGRATIQAVMIQAVAMVVVVVVVVAMTKTKKGVAHGH